MTKPKEKPADDPQADAAAPVVADYTRAAWERREGDVPGAADDLYKTLSRDRVVLTALLPRILRSWCKEQILHRMSELRASVTAIDTAESSARLRAVVAMTLFDFPLPGGKRLGDANRDEIAEAADQYARQAQTISHRARWLTVVAEKVGRHNRADAALTLAALEQLLEETRDAE
jgi:hypothetical protein